MLKYSNPEYNPFSLLISGFFTAMDAKILKQNAALAGAMMRFESQQHLFANIQSLIGLRQELEDRITSILSDYTQMINQVSIVSTLTLGMGLGAFGSLLGNVDDQPEWKVALFNCSCVLTICFSVLSVIESFFLAIHINQVEARFAGGVYPHVSKNVQRRSFEISELADLNSKFNFIVVTFFVSFLIFSTTVLGSVYISLGLSNNVFHKDVRLVGVSEHKFVNDTRWAPDAKQVPLSIIEPNYVSIASTLTFIVWSTYGIIVYRFLSSYIRQIHGAKLLRFISLCSCIDPSDDRHSHNMNTPMQSAASRFNNLQLRISELTQKWIGSTATCIVDIIKFQSKQNNTLTKNLRPVLTKFTNLINNYDDESGMLEPEPRPFSVDARKIWNDQLQQRSARYHSLGDVVWNEMVDTNMNLAVSAFDLSVLTLSHGCGRAMKIIQRASRHWNSTSEQISVFMIDETTKHVIACIEARIDVMKQHVIAENVVEAPKLFYKLSAHQKGTTLLFVFIYLIFGSIGCILSFGLSLLVAILFNLTTCCTSCPCLCCLFWKGNRWKGNRRDNSYYLFGKGDLGPVEPMKHLHSIITMPFRLISDCYDRCLTEDNTQQTQIPPKIHLANHHNPMGHQGYQYSSVLTF